MRAPLTVVTAVLGVGSWVLDAQDARELGLSWTTWAAAANVLFVIAGVSIYLDQRARISQLEPRNTLVLSPQVVQKWVHLSVHNLGHTDNFVGQVTAAIGDENMTLPWSTTWRQCEKDERRIIQSQAQLLDIGEVGHSYSYPSDPNALQGVYYYYNLVSTTARFPSAGRCVGYLAKPHLETLVDTVPEETLERCVALLVEVRGVASRSIGRKWLTLGYKLDGTPVVSLTDEEPQLTGP